MRLVRIQYLLLITALILATACNANPSGGASDSTPTPLPPGPELEQPTYTVVAVPTLQTSDWIANSCNVASSVESALQ